MNKPLVSICSITYNHAPYIRQCLDGFLMQKTNFPFEIIINDDCSTDGTTEIIKEYATKYPDLIKPIFHDENQYQKGVRGMFAKFVFPKAQGKYLALCEGDDYWIDPFKLQKQVDFLENNSDYTLVHTAWYANEEKNNAEKVFANIEKLNKEINNKYTPIDILKTGGLVLTLTVMTRREALLEVISCDKFLFSSYFLMNDTQMWYSLLSKGNFKYIEDRTAMYRISAGTACRPRSLKNKVRFLLSTKEMRLYLCKRDNLDENYTKKIEREYNKALIMYCGINKNFTPLYPIEKSNISGIIGFMYRIGLSSVFMKLWNVYDIVKRKIYEL